ncbi:MAG: ABC transporter substrate-binding protein [Lachnospiraceae bacterium]|nr:ABC transporter substrate-binding protein [Lachnospiraceae bacterium]
MKRKTAKFVSLLLAGAMAALLSACGSSDSTDSIGTESEAAAEAAEDSTAAQGTDSSTAAAGEKIINVGVTSSLGGVNPFVIDQTEINKYAVDLMFLPIVELDKDSNFQYMLADSVTTEDNVNFVVHIDDNATWSDGEPVTAYDLEYTVLRLASPIVNNTTLMLYAFEGTSDEGFVEEGAASMAGLTVLDDKTLQFTSKYPMSLTTFNNTYGRYLRALPKHMIEQFSEEELLTADWFNHPDVINGPFLLTDYDADHYISYVANESYFKGAPKIDKLNIKIVDGTQVYAGLQSGEIDITQLTMTAIPETDYESIEKLDNVTAVYGAPVTNQSAFIQTANIPDVRVRQALVYAIDRQQLVDQLLAGHGEVIDGFVSSASPYYDDSIEPLGYDPQKAKALLEEAGWDGSQALRFYVWSGDSTFVNGAQILAAQWAAVGINVEITTLDLANLMSVAGSTDYDIMAVQYTYAPVDPYPDVAWLLAGEGSWTGYADDKVNAALEDTQSTTDVEQLKADYAVVDKKVQEDVPMFSVYVISQMGAVSNRVTGAEPTVYGFFNDVQNWDVTE